MSSEEDAFKGRALARRKASLFGERQDPMKTTAPEAASTGAAGPRREPGKTASMVDVAAKPVVSREASAEGLLCLQPPTLQALRDGTVKKGDPFAVAEVAGILAAKDTPRLLPLCHPIPITSVDVSFELTAAGVKCRALVRADYKTGVEMEALTAASVALLTIWDMTKYLEKDAHGQYPETRIESLRVVEKRKGSP